MTPVDGSASVTTGVFRDRIMGCFRCDGCGALNIAIAKGRPGAEGPLKWLAARKNVEWQPQPAAEQPDWDFPDVPAQIAEAASEAYACWYHADAYRAAVIMARAVIEAAAKDKGILKGSLFEKIDAMSDMIRPHVRQGAHEVRLLGNDMAHGDLADDVSAEDAELVLRLMSEVLDDVYQPPARVAQAKAAREAKKAQQALMAAIREGKPIPAQFSLGTPGAPRPLVITMPRASVTDAAASASAGDNAQSTESRGGTPGRS